MLRSALWRLLRREGVTQPESAFVIKKKSSPSGPCYYVILAMEGIESMVDAVIASAIYRDRTMPIGVTILTELDAQRIQMAASVKRPW